MRHLSLILLVACGSSPDPCEPFCALAASTRGECLADEGLDWEAAGYEDEADYAGSCETWAWEQRLLAREAGGDPDAVGARCEALGEAVETGGCEALAAIDWDDPAWEEP